MELLVSLNSKKFEDYLDYTNSFIIGLKDFSINYLEFSLEEIKDIYNKYPDITLFVSINKNIFNDELDTLTSCLLELDKFPIKGVLFYDLSILAIAKKLHLKLNLGLHQTHLVTSYSNCNYYQEKGCKYAYLSSEITEEEILEITKNTTIELMVLFVGHSIVSHSKRSLLSNYFNYHNLPLSSNLHKFKTNDSNEYYIKETDKGTSILYGNIVNGTKSFLELRESLAYGILDENLIDHDTFIKVLSLYSKMNQKNFKINDKEEYISDIELLIGNDDGFFHKKTIYKVKKDEKN